MALKFASGDVLEHPQLNNMILGAKGWGVLEDPDSTSLAVIARSPAIMGVRVSIGKCRIADAIESEAGTTDLTIEASHATLYRKDLITYDASANIPAVVKGNDHAGGTGDPIYPPDIPTGDVLLAIVDVDAAATTIVTADIHDTRIFTKLLTIHQTIVSDDLRDSNDSIEAIPGTPYTKIKDIGPVPDGVLDGALRIKFAINETSTGTSYGRIYRNGVAVGTARSVTSDTYTTYSEDISGWHEGDTIELWGYHSLSGGDGNVKEFRVYCDYVETTLVPAVAW